MSNGQTDEQIGELKKQRTEAANMTQPLQELADFVRKTVPRAAEITDLRIMEDAGLIAFHWLGREFVVRPSLEVFEVKATKIFITGASVLLQLALVKRRRSQKVLEAVVDSMNKVEDFLKARNTETGLALLASVKHSIAISSTDRR